MCFVIWLLVLMATTWANDCPSGKFGWQCRYNCSCSGPCDRMTGHCENCNGKTWGPGCLLSSACTYNDSNGRYYQGKHSADNGGSQCIPWYPKRRNYGPDRFPEGDLKKASNYCRNPQLDNGKYSSDVWCYIHLDLSWGYCSNDVKTCSCPGGRFGVNCFSECHCSDQENTCEIDTGHCLQGCHEHFQGSSCQECVDKRFGIHCDKICRCQTQTEVCNKTSGHCLSGCASGWTGNDCQNGCTQGYYGPDCVGNCSHFCEKPRNCDKISGYCTCQAGYRPPSCHKPCIDGTFGLNCTRNCRCLNTTEICEKADGTCTQSGCAAGWHGTGCQTECAQGRYGPNCDHICSSQCVEPRNCNKELGNCQCQAGYQSPTCHKACDPGTYGINCNTTCPLNCRNTSDCNNRNGSCTCKDGFYGSLCSINRVSQGPLTGIIAGVTAVLVGIIILIIVVVLWIKRHDDDSSILRKVFHRKKSDRDEGSYTDVTVEESSSRGKRADLNNQVKPRPKGVPNAEPQQATVDEDAVYCNVSIVFDKCDIAIDMLPDYIRFMTETENGFEDEYKLIPTGPTADIDEGKLEKNRPKNRFRNIVPYNHNRVKLHKCSDDLVDGYINASYVPGYDDTVKFIAAQGPVAATLDDFNQMLWENDVPLVIMVTSLKEDKKDKCEQYWPSGKTPMVFGEITVSLLSTKRSPHYVTREMVLLKDGEKKRLLHMQFTSWPDHGVPQSPTAFLTYHKEATRYYDQTRGPVVVHCSAGVGRTGTFIAMDTLLKQAEQEGSISVYNCVTELRKHRVGMVQSLDQYIFIHEALLEALHCGKIVHDVARFETWMNGPWGQELENQFMMLEKMRRVVRPEETTAGRLEENQRKNRNPQLLPLNKWRPLLMIPVPQSNDYINAVFVKSDRGNDGILVTQSPMKNTVNDIWRLIYDYECVVVVALNVFITEDFPEYFSRQDYGPFKVSVKSTDSGEGFAKYVLTYRLQYGEQNEAILLTGDQEAPENSLPDIATLLALIEATHQARQGDTAGRILVHCRNGLNHSGLFCALSHICQKIKFEQEVDVFHAVKQIRISRPEFITSLEEYQWLHQAALSYVQSFSTYANFQ